MEFIEKSNDLVKKVQKDFAFTLLFFIIAIIGVVTGGVSTLVISALSLILLIPACCYAVGCIKKLSKIMNYKSVFAKFSFKNNIDDILLDTNKFVKSNDFEVDVYKSALADNKNEVYAMVFNPNTLTVSDINKIKFNMDRMKKRVYIFFKNSKEYDEYLPKIKSFSNIEFFVPVVIEENNAIILYKIIEFRNNGFKKIEKDLSTLFDMSLKDIVTIEKK